MSGNSKIEWTDRTWNPVTGCNKVSPGCKNCYANDVADRFFAKQYPPNPDGSPRRFTDVRTHEDRLNAPLHWRKPAMIFVNSMSDLFHESVPYDFIDQVFSVMALCPQHTFQILTKRPERMRQYMEGLLGHVEERISQAGCDLADSPCAAGIIEDAEWPLLNVWLGVSIENQPTADERIPLLLRTLAAVRFISYEPALALIDLTELPSHSGIGRYLDSLSNAGVDPGAEVSTKLDWVICGGESGPKARPCNVEWLRSVVQQCKAAGVPCFVKQLGAVPMETEEAWRGRALTRLLKASNAKRVPEGMVPLLYRDSKGGDPVEWPTDLMVREYPERAA